MKDTELIVSVGSFLDILDKREWDYEDMKWMIVYYQIFIPSTKILSILSDLDISIPIDLKFVDSFPLISLMEILGENKDYIRNLEVSINGNVLENIVVTEQQLFLTNQSREEQFQKSNNKVYKFTNSCNHG